MRLLDSRLAVVTTANSAPIFSRFIGGQRPRTTEAKRMKQKYEGKDLQGLVDLGREQGYLTFDRSTISCRRTWPRRPICARRSTASRTWISRSSRRCRAARATTKSRPKPRKRPRKRRGGGAPADSLGESSDPVRLYLKEMGNFQLLSREQEVEIAKRIEAGENEVEDEVLRSPVTLGFCDQDGRTGRGGRGRSARYL